MTTATKPRTSTTKKTAKPKKAAPAKKSTNGKASTTASPATASVPMTNEQLELAVTSVPAEVPLTKIVPAEDNVRDTAKNLGDLDGLAESIAAVGILEPLIVEPHPTRKGYWRLIAGERRLRAAKRTKLTTAPVIVRTGVDDTARVEAMLVENLQREGLGHVEQMHGFARLADAGWGQRKIAQRIGCNQSHVSKHLQLRSLPAEALKALDGDLPMNDALELVKIADDPDAIRKIINRLADARRGYYADSVSHQVASVKREREMGAKVAARIEELRGQDVTVFGDDDETDGYEDLEWLELDANAHATEPCHAVHVSRGYLDKVNENPLCMHPAAHLPDGASELKLTEPTIVEELSGGAQAPPSWERRRGTTSTSTFDPEAEKARRARVRELDRKRRAFIADALAKPPPLATLAQRRFLTEVSERLNKDPRVQLAKLLELPDAAAEDGTNLAVALLAYAGESTANLERAVLALAFMQGETDWRPAVRAEHRHLLASLGYELADDELEIEDDEDLERLVDEIQVAQPALLADEPAAGSAPDAAGITGPDGEAGPVDEAVDEPWDAGMRASIADAGDDQADGKLLDVPVGATRAGHAV